VGYGAQEIAATGCHRHALPLLLPPLKVHASQQLLLPLRCLLLQGSAGEQVVHAAQPQGLLSCSHAAAAADGMHGQMRLLLLLLPLLLRCRQLLQLLLWMTACSLAAAAQLSCKPGLLPLHQICLQER
jgi:hypothetical protein